MSEVTILSKSAGLTTTGRTILVYNQPKQKAAQIIFNGTKWSELAKIIENHPDLQTSSVSTYDVVLTSSKLTLELPAAEIPDGDQKIFLYEKKVKSGAVAKPVTKSAYDGMKYNELRTLVKDKGLGAGLSSSPTREALVAKLEGAAGVKSSVVTKTTPSGKVKETVVKETPVEAVAVIVKDTEILNNQPTLEQRMSALEGAFSKFIDGMYSVCKDFIAPVVETKAVKVVKSLPKLDGKIDLNALANEARQIKGGSATVDNSNWDNQDEDENDEDED